jgi:hypothetical protein
MQFPEADCFRIYRDVRRDFPEQGLELGQGINEFPSAPELVGIITGIFTELHKSGRSRDYSGWSDKVVEAACVSLIQEHFALDPKSEVRVLFTNGAGEGINLCLGALADMGLSAMVPQPSYFAYEQSMLQYRMPFAGRYRRFLDTVVSDDESRPYVLIQAEPNPLDGSIAPVPAWAQDDPKRQFDMIDAVFLLARPGAEDQFHAKIRARLASCSFDRACLLLTPSKDLSFPAIRCGIIYTSSPEVIEFVERDQCSRVFRPSPLIGFFCLFYLCCLRLYDLNRRKGHAHANSRNEDIAMWLTDLGIGGWYPKTHMLQIVAHLEKMTANCDENSQLLAGHPGLRMEPGPLSYIAGFSAFPQVDVLISSHSDLVQISNRLGRVHGLFLNPSVVFGGTIRSWDALFPTEARIRLNLSLPTFVLEQGLERLGAAIS